MRRSPREVATLLHAALEVQLREDGLDADLCSKTLYPGQQVPMDFGGPDTCGGMVYLIMESAVISTAFPNQEQRPDWCNGEYAMQFAVGFMIPAPEVQEFQGHIELPSEEDERTSALLTYDYMDSLRKACARAAQELDDTLLGAFQPQGPEGGAVGGSWAFTVGAGAN